MHMSLMTANSVKIVTRLFRMGKKRIFLSLPKSKHPELDKFTNHFVHVVLRNQKEEKLFSFPTKIVKIPLENSVRMYIEIPLQYHKSVKKDMLTETNSIIATISELD
jgi:hypothetical protein